MKFSFESKRFSVLIAFIKNFYKIFANLSILFILSLIYAYSLYLSSLFVIFFKILFEWKIINWFFIIQHIRLILFFKFEKTSFWKMLFIKSARWCVLIYLCYCKKINLLWVFNEIFHQESNLIKYLLFFIILISFIFKYLFHCVNINFNPNVKFSLSNG